MRQVSVVCCDCANDGAASPMPRARTVPVESKSDFMMLPPLEVECGGTGCKFSAVRCYAAVFRCAYQAPDHLLVDEMPTGTKSDNGASRAPLSWECYVGKALARRGRKTDGVA